MTGGNRGDGKRPRLELTVVFVLLDSRLVSFFGDTGSRGTRLLLRHGDAELQRGRAVGRGPSQLDLELDLDLGRRWLNLLLRGK